MTNQEKDQKNNRKKTETHVVSAHRFKHLLELNAQLLNVVHQGTRLQPITARR